MCHAVSDNDCCVTRVLHAMRCCATRQGQDTDARLTQPPSVHGATRKNSPTMSTDYNVRGAQPYPHIRATYEELLHFPSISPLPSTSSCRTLAHSCSLSHSCSSYVSMVVAPTSTYEAHTSTIRVTRHAFAHPLTVAVATQSRQANIPGAHTIHHVHWALLKQLKNQLVA